MDNFDYSNVAWETDNKGGGGGGVEDNVLSQSQYSNDLNVEYSQGFTSQYNDIPFTSEENLPSSSQTILFNNNNNDNSNNNNISGIEPIDSDAKLLNIIPMVISVNDHQKENEGTTDAHISYLISTKTSLPSFTAPEVKVRRRFQDFVWLYNGLTQDYPASVIPPLPEKHRLEYITGDRFSTDFIEKRRVSLERFLNRLAIHPTLQRTDYMKKFLDSPDWSADSVQKVKGEGVLENLSDSIVNAFSRVKKPNAKFTGIKDSVDKFEENLTAIDKMHQKVLKKQIEMESEYIDLSNGMSNLGLLETGMSNSLNHFAEVVKEFSNELKIATKTEDMYYLSHIREYLAYCQSVKAVLKLRDQKQVDVEELTDYLQAQVAEQSKIQSTGRAGGLSNFFKDKYDGIKGVDQEQAKLNRLAKCEEKIKELEDAVSQSTLVESAFSKEAEKEFHIFAHSKQVDLKEALVNYSHNKIEFFKRSIDLWEKVLPKLEDETLTGPTRKVKDSSNPNEDISNGNTTKPMPSFLDDPLMNPYANTF